MSYWIFSIKPRDDTLIQYSYLVHFSFRGNSQYTIKPLFRGLIQNITSYCARILVG